MNPVDQVIRTHDGEHSLFDDNLKRLQIEFAKSSLINIGTQVKPIHLLLVGDKVFCRRADALALNPLDETRCHLSCQNRIFPQILKITPAKWCAIKVHSGA